MSRWGLFFLLTPVACVVVFAIAESIGWSLPPNYSTIGEKIDHLYYVLLAVTGVVFIFTQFGLAFLVYFYAESKDGSSPASRRSLLSIASWLFVPVAGFLLLVIVFPMPMWIRAVFGVSLAVGWLLVMALLLIGRHSRAENRALYSHGNMWLEITWTVVPAAIIIFITFYQMPVWEELRYPRPMPEGVVPIRVIGRQFEWRIVYPGPDGKLDTADDLRVPNELHVVKDQEVWIDLRSMDVIHSFFLPMHRIKQDAVPGLAIPVWFDCRASTWDYQAEDPFYRDRDVLDVGGVCRVVRTGESGLAKLVRDKWGERLCPPEGSSVLDAAQMASGLNAVVSEGDLWAGSGISHEAVPWEVRELAKQRPEGARLRLLNRMLLDMLLASSVRSLDRHFDIICTELCGWGHYRMKGRMFVHDSKESLDAWLSERQLRQEAVR